MYLSEQPFRRQEKSAKRHLKSFHRSPSAIFSRFPIEITAETEEKSLPQKEIALEAKFFAFQPLESKET